MFKIVERSQWKPGDPYSRYAYRSSEIINSKVFKKIIESLGGYVYNNCVGRICNYTISNGYTWVGVHGTGSYKENDLLLKRFDEVLRKEIECV